MLLRSVTFCCFMLSVQPHTHGPETQNFPSQSPFYISDQIFFDNRPPLVLPIDNTRLQQSLPVRPSNVRNPLRGVENNNDVTVNRGNGVERQVNPQADQTIRGVTANKPVTNLDNPTSEVSNVVGFNKVLYSVTNFGLNLLRNINAAGNVVVSPYSITSALALLQQGAQGQTKQQISTALQMTPEESATSYSEISQDFNKRNSRNILKSASNVFVAETFSLNPDFKKIAIRNFNSAVTPITFSNPMNAANEINSWVASQTNNKIERLITPDALEITTQMVLVNAVYFKGLWEIPFRAEDTKPQEFHYSSGATKMVPFMTARRYLKTGLDTTTNAKAVIIPFERSQYSLMLIVPSSLLGISGTLEHLTDARLLSYHSYPEREISLHLPKFTVRGDTDLIPVLRKMGITDMFGTSSDLSKLGLFRAYSPHVSSAAHSALLSIDEQGGSAAAATYFAGVALSNDGPAITLRVDKPFIAVLWDEKTSLPLFMAKIEDPSQ